MKKATLALSAAIMAALSAGVWAPAAAAHDFWLSVIAAAPGSPLVLTLGYGHNFPVGEPIPEENLGSRFQSIVVEGPGGPLVMGRGEDSTLIESDKPVQAGLYVVHGSTTPLFLTQTTEGWSIRAKDEVDNPIASNLSVKHAKTVIAAGEARTAGEEWSKPVGQTLEITPLADPTTAKSGTPLPVRVLFRGEPLPEAEIALLGEGDETAASKTVTDSKGEASLTPVRAGFWRIIVERSIPYEGDRTKADNELNISTFVFKAAP